jgi:proline dehydrogenase
MTALYDTAPPAPPPRLTARLKGAALSAASGMLVPALRRIAPGEVGGETLADAWLVARAVAAEGHALTLGYWDSLSDTPDRVFETYLDAIPWLSAEGGYLSVKPPALRFDRRAADRLAEAAARAQVRLHCDSHGPDAAEPTLAFAEALRAQLGPGQVSVSVPGRWRRSPADAVRLAERGIGVRIVKGQWPDDEDQDLRQGFLAVASALAGAESLVAVATHDRALAEAALMRLHGRAELEMIRGLETRALLALAAATGRPTRLYIPYGPGFAPSALRILKNNPRLALGLLRRLARR